MVWALLLGGVLTRYAPAARDAPRQRFVEAGGRYFFRFVRLALLAAVKLDLTYFGHTIHDIGGLLAKETCYL